MEYIYRQRENKPCDQEKISNNLLYFGYQKLSIQLNKNLSSTSFIEQKQPKEGTTNKNRDMKIFSILIKADSTEKEKPKEHNLD